MKDRSDKPEASDPASRIDICAPKRPSPVILMELPQRPTARKESVDPTWKKFRTETELPNRVAPKAEMPDPIRP
jgi:hypothetical protein